MANRRVHGMRTVERLLRQLGLRDVDCGPKARMMITDEAAGRPVDLVERDFSASGPNELWVTNLSYVVT